MQIKKARKVTFATSVLQFATSVLQKLHQSDRIYGPSGCPETHPEQGVYCTRSANHAGYHVAWHVDGTDRIVQWLDGHDIFVPGYQASEE